MKNRRQSGNFQFEKNPFSKSVRGSGKVYHEVLLLMNILQTNPEVMKMNNNYYDLDYTVNKNRDDKEIVDDKYEKNEIVQNNFIDYITPNHNKSNKPRETILK